MKAQVKVLLTVSYFSSTAPKYVSEYEYVRDSFLERLTKIERVSLHDSPKSITVEIEIR